MNTAERWTMYYDISRLKELGLKVSQLARHLHLSRNTVYKYVNLTPSELDQVIIEQSQREKKLAPYGKEILSWLKEFPDLSAAQVLDWLIDRHPEKKINVCESTVRSYVSYVRKEYDIPKTTRQRQYEAIEDPPMGYQMQVDFGEIKLRNTEGSLVKLQFISFVLSHSRYKYVEWLNRPFTTADVIRAHEDAFAYFSGIPKEIVYDQDHLILVSENSGDLILTHEFAAYAAKRRFKIYMCRKQDPESKGRIENVVGYVKKNFARYRTYYNLDRLNEDCLAWLERTGNGKIHNTTKKKPAEVYALEKQHLRPVLEKMDIDCTNSITRDVRKDNTVWYCGNRYSIPLGTYDNTKKKSVKVEVIDDILIINDQETGEELTRYPLCKEKGKLITNSNHRRDRTKGIDQYIETVANNFPDPDQAKAYLEKIRTEKPRYIRDQLQLIQQNIETMDKQTITRALEFCLKNKLFSATDLVDAVKYFENRQLPEQQCSFSEPNPLPLNHSKLNIKPQIRDIKVYQEIMNGGQLCQERPPS
ncbi:MAG: IS21 family transposase [Bacillota bacterium]